MTLSAMVIGHNLSFTLTAECVKCDDQVWLESDNRRFRIIAIVSAKTLIEGSADITMDIHAIGGSGYVADTPLIKQPLVTVLNLIFGR